MRFIGITGGVGAGKSEVLRFLAGRQHTRVMLADEIAHRLMEPKGRAYDKLCEEFAGEDIFEASVDAAESRPYFDREKLARFIFEDDAGRERLNGIVHPAVKGYVREQALFERERGELTLLVLEAALLIEEKYDEICDELWYIDTDEKVRRSRLKASRGYSDARIDQIFASQMKAEAYRSACRIVIDNNGEWESTREQIERALRREADE